MRIGQVRKAKVEDAFAIASVHVRSWQVAYRGQMPDEFLDGLDVEKRTSMWRELTQNPDKIIFVAEITKVKLKGSLRWARPATQMPVRTPPRLAQSTFIQRNGEEELAAHCCPRRSTRFESASLTKLPYGYWKQTNEHGLFTNRSDLSRRALSKTTTIGKALPCARFAIVLT
jgi:hypothetical protein